MQRDFTFWLSQFKSSISDYKYYINFDKVCANTDAVKIELNILNSLVGSKNIKEDFIELAHRYPEILKCIPILVAVRSSEIYAQDEDGGYLYQFNEKMSVEDATRFLEKSGLFDMISNKITHDLVDYVLGIEAGLDSNGRKNRGGHLMEDLVEHYIVKSGFVRDESYFKEMRLSEIEKRWGLDLSAISNNGKAEKRFDFVIKTPQMTYAIETNFYAGGGSKLNETARSYKMLTQEAEAIPNFSFIWITDGSGWTSAKKNLQETFDAGCYVYNIVELEEGKLDTLE